MENGNYKVKLRIVYDKNTRVILGAQISSDYDISMVIHLFSMAIEEQVTIAKLKLFDAFFLPTLINLTTILPWRRWARSKRTENPEFTTDMARVKIGIEDGQYEKEDKDT